MIAFVAEHWKKLLAAALAVVAALAVAFYAGRFTAPKPEQPKPEVIKVSDIEHEAKLKSEVAKLQRELAAAHSESASSATFTAPDGSKVDLHCESQAQTLEVHEATQVAVQQCEDRIVYRDRLEVNPPAPTVTAPGRLDMHFAAGAVVLGKPKEGSVELGAMAGARLGPVRTDLFVTTSPFAPLKSPTIGAAFSAEF